MLSRRTLLFSTAAVAITGLGVQSYSRRGAGEAVARDGEFEITRSAEAWKKLLTPDQYAVLREEATEQPNSSPLLHEKRKGTFHCAACDLPVYQSEYKYDSGTGWPSFTQAIEGAIATKTDFKILVPRTEVHCRRCGGHFGHIFDDGPKPTGKRHCLNGLALKFVEA